MLPTPNPKDHGKGGKGKGKYKRGRSSTPVGKRPTKGEGKRRSLTPADKARLDVVSIGTEDARRARTASSAIRRSIDRRADHRIVMEKGMVALRAPTEYAMRGRRTASANSGTSASFFTMRRLPSRRGHLEKATLRRRAPGDPARTRRPQSGRGR